MRCRGATKQGITCKNHGGDVPYCRHHKPPPLPPLETIDAPEQDDTSEKGGETCPICLNGVPTSDCFTLSCNHTFCRPCILRWLKKKRDCPMCRAIPPREDIAFRSTAPADGRAYDETRLPVDWTDEESAFDQVESLDVPPFDWNLPDSPGAMIVTWRFPFWH